MKNFTETEVKRTLHFIGLSIINQKLNPSIHPADDQGWDEHEESINDDILLFNKIATTKNLPPFYEFKKFWGGVVKRTKV